MDRIRGLFRAARRARCRGHRHGGAARARAHHAHRAGDADLQRGHAARRRRARVGVDFAGARAAGGRIRPLHPLGHYQARDRRRGGGTVAAPERAHRGRGTHLLPAPHRPQRPQGRQHRRMGAQPRPRLRVHAGAGRGQHHERGGAGDAGARDGGASAHRHPAEPATCGRARDAVRAPHPVRLAPAEPHALERPCLLAARREQLLGPQRDPARGALRAALPAAAALGLPALRRCDPQPRLRGGSLHAPRRLRGAPAAATDGFLGRSPARTSSTTPRATGAGRRGTCNTCACWRNPGCTP